MLNAAHRNTTFHHNFFLHPSLVLLRILEALEVLAVVQALELLVVLLQLSILMPVLLLYMDMS